MEEGEIINTGVAQQAAASTERIRITYENPQIVWSKTMDMMALISTSDKMIEVHRVGFKHQKIFVQEEKFGPTAIELTSNGKHIIVGYKDGSVGILENEARGEGGIFDERIDDVSPQITTLCCQETA